jgi:hypothetical protein
MDERAPVTRHIEGLETHIRSMYEELLEEFEMKGKIQQDLSMKDQKLSGIMQEVRQTRQTVLEKERYISSFKKDLELLMGITNPRDLEDAVRECVRKYLRGEQRSSSSSSSLKASALKKGSGRSGSSRGQRKRDGAKHGSNDRQEIASRARSEEKRDEELEELVDSLRSAHKQREFMEKQVENLRSKLSQTKKEGLRTSRGRLQENASLIHECNDLRRENSTLKREVDLLRHSLSEEKKVSRGLSMELADFGLEKETGGQQHHHAEEEKRSQHMLSSPPPSSKKSRQSRSRDNKDVDISIRTLHASSSLPSLSPSNMTRTHLASRERRRKNNIEQSLRKEIHGLARSVEEHQHKSALQQIEIAALRNSVASKGSLSSLS